MGLVETGVGLIPGAGGTKEMLIKATQELSEDPANDLFPNMKRAWETIALAKVSGSALDAVKIGYLSWNTQMVMNQDYLLSEAKKALLYLAGQGFRPLKKKPVKVLGNSAERPCFTTLTSLPVPGQVYHRIRCLYCQRISQGYDRRRCSGRCLSE